MKEGLAVNNVGVGIDARIAHLTNRSRHKKAFNRLRLGSFSYIFSVFGALVTQKGFSIRVMTNGEELLFERAF